MTDIVQAEVLEFLASPTAYGLHNGSVDRHRTHISEVYLVGDRAFKVKRAVRYAFVDFSTLDARRAACEAEVRLNRRTAPDIYLGTAAVRRDESGRLSLDRPDRAAAGEPVEWVVVMRRFDETLTLDRLADQNKLLAGWIDTLVDETVAMHDGAEVLNEHFGGHAGLDRVMTENAADMRTLGGLWAPARLDALIATQREWLERSATLLDGRRAQGHVRRCHGDLHLGNVVLWHDRPTIFDCIEFSDDIAVIDVAYDLAFLLMDLEVRGFRSLANRALGRYLGRQGGVEILAALPVMMSLRACVRAKVAAMTIASLSNKTESAKKARDAEILLQAAERFVAAARPPCLVAIGGLSGTGKSTLAMGLAPHLGRAPGALVLRSDVIRKRLAGVAPEQHLPAESYTQERNRAVYEVLLGEAEAALKAGQSVIADAVFGQEQERQAIEAVAARGIRFYGIWLDASGTLLKQRVARRTGDASDATPAVIDRQLTFTTGEMTWRRLDASHPFEAVLAQATDGLPME